MFPGSAMELGALCLYGIEELVGLLLCRAWDESWPEKNPKNSLLSRKMRFFNLGFVAFLRETKLERLLALPTGVWRGGVPGPALQVLPGTGV